MAEIVVRENQTPYDLAIEAYGSVEGVFQLMDDNPWISLDAMPDVGRRVVVNGEALNAEVKDYLTRKKIEPANGGGNDPGVSAFSDGYNQETVN